MEEVKKSIDSETKFSWKIKWILVALLLALWSSNFSYSQESDSLQQENRYEKIDFIKMDSYIKFDEIEDARQETIKYRNSIFEMTRQLFTKDERLWFPEFYDIRDETEKLLKWIENEENCSLILNNLIRQLEYDISVEKNAECRQALTNILSIVKDKKNILNWVVNDPIELLKQNLKVWDIILINKKLKAFDIWSAALKFFDEKYLTDFTHVLIFIWFDEDWNIMVRHSTTETERLHKIWVEETSFLSYLFDSDRCDANWCDVLVLRPIPEIRQSILDFSKDKILCWYDSKAALFQWLWLKNDFNDKYNCVELVTHWIQRDSLYSQGTEYAVWFKWDLQKSIDETINSILDLKVDELNWMTFPNDLLGNPWFFKDVYMTTIFRK